MTVKIFKGIFITSVTVLLASLVVFFFFSYDYFGDRLEDEVVREAEYLKRGFDEAEAEADKLDYLGSLSLDGAFVTLIKDDGTVVFDTRTDAPEKLSNHANREEVREAKAVGEGLAVRQSETDGIKTLYCARRTSDGRILRVGTEHFSATDVLAAMVSPTLVLFLCVLLFALLAAMLMSRSIVKPINDIDLDDPENTKAYEELRPILNKLASQNYRITKQMHELRKREIEFNSITGNMSEGMVIINSRTAILSCNASAKRIFGVGDEELAGGVLSLNSSESFRLAISSALSGKNGYDAIRIGDKYYSVLVTPVFNGARVDGAVIVIIDDTEKEERETLRREFTANVSHELKTPLTSISGFAELISEGIADEEDSKRFASNIMKESKRLISLVGDIIRLNQLDGGEIPFDPVKISLRECAREVIGRLEHIAERSEVSLEVSGSEGLVDGNRQIIEEMLYNLTDNAIKYNKTGGRVAIFVAEDSLGVSVSVKDTGIGIPADKLDRVFERFYRVDKSHSKEIGGTGLGLSIVKHAAAYHKAKISIESVLGEWTEITVVFPHSALSESADGT
ncbi:MAG: histidine kinase [Clostridia bacterium]|nr:histidine kinase [Clostridia bacterium]